jgi:enoyl-CoA hydratase
VTLGYTEAEAVARLIGPSTLKYLLFSGELIQAEDALRVGLVDRVVPPEGLADSMADLVTRILNSSAVTMEASKAVASMCGRPAGQAEIEQLTRFTIEAYGGADLKEGVAAFIAGRAPNFPNERGATLGGA